MKHTAIGWLEDQLKKYNQDGWCKIPSDELLTLLDAATEYEYQLQDKYYEEGWKGAKNAIMKY